MAKQSAKAPIKSAVNGTNGTNGTNGAQPKRSYTTHSGVTLEFQPVSAWTVQYINLKWDKLKPLPPKIKTSAGEEYYDTEPHYLDALATWQRGKESEMNEAMIKLGVITEAPAAFIETYQRLFPELDAESIKVHWIFTLFDINDADELGLFFSMVAGQTAVTDEGLKEASKSFQGDD